MQNKLKGALRKFGTKLVLGERVRFKVIFGVDQTGAVDRRGRPRPLPAAMLVHDLNGRRLLRAIKLGSAQKRYFENAIESEDIELDTSGEVLIVLDAVLGLPVANFPENKSLFQLFENAADYQFKGRRFGREVAYEFFTGFLSAEASSGTEFPRRHVEVVARANSVFRMRPFQKNVGCGSYRLWRDLGAKNKWFHVWPFERVSRVTPTIMEGYPSYLWKNLFKVRKPKFAEIEKWFTEKEMDFFVDDKSRELFETKKDYLDAAALALAAAYYMENDDLFPDVSSDSKNAEGWILGVDSK